MRMWSVRRMRRSAPTSAPTRWRPSSNTRSTTPSAAGRCGSAAGATRSWSTRPRCRLRAKSSTRLQSFPICARCIRCTTPSAASPPSRRCVFPSRITAGALAGAISARWRSTRGACLPRARSNPVCARSRALRVTQNSRAMSTTSGDRARISAIPHAGNSSHAACAAIKTVLPRIPAKISTRTTRSTSRCCAACGAFRA